MWVRHSDFYTAEYRLPDEDGTEPVRRSPGARPSPPRDGRRSDPDRDARRRPTEAEVRRQYWGPLRSAPSRALAVMLRIYRRLISPLYGQVCSFYPSCSAYGLEAITVHGVTKGIPMTAWRILRCNPFSGGGVDHVRCGRRIWPQGRVPTIIETNHPPMAGQPSASQISGDHRDGPASPRSAEPRAGSP